MRAKLLTNLLTVTASLFLAATAPAAVTLTDLGTTAPTPGPNDIFQLAGGGNAGSGAGSLNYYWDDGANHTTVGYPGQTFTTLNNPQGYILTSVAISTAGHGGGTPTQNQSFTLSIYQLSNPLGLTPATTGLTNATLVASYSTTFALAAEGDWIQWSGLATTLAPGTNYVIGFGRSVGSPGDWEEINVATNLPYAGGQACLVPVASGKLTYSTTLNDYDMTFDIGLSLPAAPIANAPIEAPAFAHLALLAGTNVNLTATAAGSGPITYTWYTDGGTGGSFTNIPGAASSNLVVNTAGWLPGVYNYEFLASNSLGTSFSVPAALSVTNVMMADLGTNLPTPGPIDISQMLNTAQADDGFNYYTDDGAGHGAWAGQTFTTGTNVSGYTLNSLTWLSAGNGNSFPTIQLYDFYVYSLTPDGATASQIAAYQVYGGGKELDWFKWVGLNVALAPNTKYAYAFGRDGASTGWEHIADQSGNLYPGGQICTIPTPAGGAVTYGPAGTSDATFDLGLSYSLTPFAFPPTYTPSANPVYAGTVITLTDAAVGPPPLSYQWLADNGTGTLATVGGATTSNLVVDTTSLAPGNYEYEVVVTNSAGVSTSAVTTVVVTSASLPLITTDISPTNLNEGYVGETISFTSAFAGTLPITYQWFVDTGSGPVAISSASNPSAISNTLVLANLQAGNAGTYSVQASNSVGTNYSSPSTLVVFPVPSSALNGTYGTLVLADGPVAYWPLTDLNDPSTGVSPAYDATGHGFDGVYGVDTENGFDAIAGPQPPAFPGFAANTTALFTQNGSVDSYVTVPATDLNTNTVTISMWINPSGAELTFEGLLMNRNGADAAGLGFGSTQNTSAMAELGYTWNTNNASTYNFNSGLYPVAGVWSFVALVVQPTQATLYLYYIDPNTGQPDLYSAVNPIPHSVEKFTGGTTLLGSDSGGATARSFSGDIAQVAVFNQALSSDQILSMFSKGAGLTTTAPSIAGQPASQGVYAGKTVTFTATGVNGTSPLSYQWQFDGVNLTNGAGISGATNLTLTLSNVVTVESGTYQLLVRNPVTTTASSNAVLEVVTPAPGSYEASVLENGPFAFWKLDETNADPAAGNAIASDFVGGFNGVYGTAVQDGFSSYDILGPQAPEFAGFPTNNTAMLTANGVVNSFMSATAGTIATNTVTYAMWINPNAPAATFDGLLMNRSGPSGGDGLGFGGDTDSTGMADLGYTWNNNNQDTWGFSTFLFPPTNQWSFVAMVIQPTQGTLYLINGNGVQTAVNAIAHDSEEFAVAWRLGDDATGNNGARTFPGRISSASVYLSALSSNQLVALYDAGAGVAPPVSINIAPIGGQQLTLTWSQGSLLQATDLNGPWTTNTANSPYTVSATNSHMYFKVRVK
ncbi:MAG TPA: LamG-like jellyroll fold domain-containing protein [Verrucomicrobiae bacterium]|jgi:hypothetical protein